MKLYVMTEWVAVLLGGKIWSSAVLAESQLGVYQSVEEGAIILL
jgi:hypothetical protein